jgi:hypothetical protein
MIVLVAKKIDHEIKTQKEALLGNFDLMIDLSAASAIMRSKVFYAELANN